MRPQAGRTTKGFGIEYWHAVYGGLQRLPDGRVPNEAAGAHVKGSDKPPTLTRAAAKAGTERRAQPAHILLIFATPGWGVPGSPARAPVARPAGGGVGRFRRVEAQIGVEIRSGPGALLLRLGTGA